MHPSTIYCPLVDWKKNQYKYTLANSCFIAVAFSFAPSPQYEIPFYSHAQQHIFDNRYANPMVYEGEFYSLRGRAICSQ